MRMVSEASRRSTTYCLIPSRSHVTHCCSSFGPVELKPSTVTCICNLSFLIVILSLRDFLDLIPYRLFFATRLLSSHILYNHRHQIFAPQRKKIQHVHKTL